MAGIYSDCSTREIITTAKGSLAMYVGNRGNSDTAGGFCKCSGIFHNQISLSLFARSPCRGSERHQRRSFAIRVIKSYTSVIILPQPTAAATNSTILL